MTLKNEQTLRQAKLNLTRLHQSLASQINQLDDLQLAYDLSQKSYKQIAADYQSGMSSI